MMQTFKDGKGEIFQYEDGLEIDVKNGKIKKGGKVVALCPKDLVSHMLPGKSQTEKLDDARAQAKILMSKALRQTEAVPVLSNGFEWGGGWSNVNKLSALIQAATASGNTTIKFADTNHDIHDLQITEAKAILSDMVGVLDAANLNYHSKAKAINQASSEAAVNAVKWE